MSTNVAILDYGSGNLRSAQRALERTGADVTVTSDMQEALNADGLVVPGVGAYEACMTGLREVRGERIIGRRLAGGRPVVSRYRFVTASGETVPVLLASQTVLGADGEVLGLSGFAFDLRLCPALQGEPGVLSSLRVPPILRVPAKPTTNYTAKWVSNHLPVDTFICENDESYSIRVNRGAMEETLGYSTEDFRKAGPIKPWSVLHPDDQDVSDAYFEAAASREGTITVARIRPVAKSTEAVPVLVFARGIKLPDTDEIAISGGVLNITHVPGLQGPSKLLSTQTPV